MTRLTTTLRYSKLHNALANFQTTKNIVPNGYYCKAISHRPIPPLALQRYFSTNNSTSPSSETQTVAQRVVNNLPLSVQPYAHLIRFNRPVGSWLLFWPCGKHNSPPPLSLLKKANYYFFIYLFSFFCLSKKF